MLGIDHVQLAAPPGSEETARRFYGGVLGLTELPKPEALRARGGVWFRVGSQELHIGIDDPFVPARKAHPGFVTSDLDGLIARLTVAGFDPVPDGAIPGVRRVFVDDPFGNRLEVRQVA